MEQPVLRLGLLGFAEEPARFLRDCAGQSQSGWPTWRVDDPHRADAWMISGSAVDVQDRDGLLIRHPLDSGERLALHRAEVDRPLAFATPLPEGFASAEFFDGHDPVSVRQRLQRFEAWLRPLRSQFALGARMVEHLRQFREGVVHVVHEGKLQAVIDLDRWLAGLSISARPVDIASAEWLHRPRLAGELPPSFMRLPLHRVMWTYAVRTQRNILPARYRVETIYLRRLPRLPARWFDGLHLALMQALVAAPGRFDDLVERTAADADAVAQHLAALYYAGGITTDGIGARRTAAETRRAVLALQFQQVDESREARETDMGASEQAPPSSILREWRHSPLKSVDGDPVG